MVLKEEKANAMWDVLVAHCGAQERNRQDFVSVVTNQDIKEYRFGGDFGFGGKIWIDRCSVTCYREKSTPDIEARIAVANELLSKLS